MGTLLMFVGSSAPLLRMVPVSLVVLPSALRTHSKYRPVNALLALVLLEVSAERVVSGANTAAQAEPETNETIDIDAILNQVIGAPDEKPGCKGDERDLHCALG